MMPDLAQNSPPKVTMPTLTTNTLENNKTYTYSYKKQDPSHYDKLTHIVVYITSTNNAACKDEF